MAYSVDSLKPGDVLLLTTSPRDSLPARLLDVGISWFTDSPFVHAAIVGDGHLVESLWHVTRSPLGKYAATGWAFRPQATDEQKAQAVAWAEAHVGAAYSIGEILEDAARFGLHLVRPAWYSWRRSTYTCSGLVMASYASAGVALSYAPAVAPADLSYSPLLIGRRPWETATA